LKSKAVKKERNTCPPSRTSRRLRGNENNNIFSSPRSPSTGRRRRPSKISGYNAITREFYFLYTFSPPPNEYDTRRSRIHNIVPTRILYTTAVAACAFLSIQVYGMQYIFLGNTHNIRYINYYYYTYIYIIGTYNVLVRPLTLAVRRYILCTRI